MARGNRLTVIHGVLVLFACALVAQAAKVQIVHGKEWEARGKRQHFFASSLPAQRGDILDATGEPLVESRELSQIAIAPAELRDSGAVLRVLRARGVPEPIVRAIKDPRRRWVEVPGLFAASDIASIAGVRGVHVTAVMQRVYSNSAGVRRIVGRIDAGGKALDGVESALDPVLRGDSGRASVARDKSGRALDSPEGWASAPQSGSTVVLTINHALQDICERELGIAIDSLHAAGGDIVVMNPHTGEVLALASRRADPGAVANTALTEPFEPGSTLKPFVAAALLRLKRARPEEVINTFNGKLELDGRTITDMHKASALSLADVIRFSSNVGIVRFGERLTPREKYENFRDFGFGMATGVPLPAESPGTLRDPNTWSNQTPASILMGYEIAVTPLQLVAAYSAIANGGELLEPHLVKEVRNPEGTVVYRAERKVVRRVIDEPVARAVQQMLLGVVQGGTATKADLETFSVAGKSGTARRITQGGGYGAGNYTASFVGLFPGNDPQYVVLVKLDSPQGSHYAGGDIAAPVTSVVLRAALAARDAALDREGLAAAERKSPADTPAARNATVGARNTRAKGVSAVIDDEGEAGSVSYVVRLPASSKPAAVAFVARAVPDVSGMSLRGAVHALHAAGFRVRLVPAAAIATVPAAGAIAQPGTVVQLGRPAQ